jgi:hypothetical protein
MDLNINKDLEEIALPSTYDPNLGSEDNDEKNDD